MVNWIIDSLDSFWTAFEQADTPSEMVDALWIGLRLIGLLLGIGGISAFVVLAIGVKGPEWLLWIVRKLTRRRK